MGIVRQIVLGIAAILAAVIVWAVYVPAAAPVLDRIGIYGLLGVAPPSETPAAGRRGGGGPTRVGVAAAVEGRINSEVSAIGDARAIRAVTVRAEATGMIRDLAVTAGTEVSAGALIVQLDDDAERIALERAQLMVTDTTDDLDRLRQLEASGAVTSVQLRAAELAVRSAALELRQAELDVERRRVLAPIDGWIGLIEVERGDRITAQDDIAVITDRSSIQIDFRVPERFVGQIDIGTPLTVAPLASRDAVMTGEIVALDNQIDRASRTLRVQGRIDNTGDRLRAGQAFAVTLSFPGETLPGVNPLAVQWSRDGSYVWVVRDDAAERVPVVIRQRNSDAVLVEGALAVGEPVVTEGVQTLRDGAPVSIIDDGGSGAYGGDATAAAGQGRAI